MAKLITMSSSLMMMTLISAMAALADTTSVGAGTVLVEFSGESAVFELGGLPFRVRKEAFVGSTGARLVHIGTDEIVVEFSARDESGPVRASLRRGALVDRGAGRAGRTRPAVAVSALEIPQDSPADEPAKER